MGAQPNANIFFVFLFALSDILHDDFYIFLHSQKAVKWH